VVGAKRWLIWLVSCTIVFGAARAVALPEVCGPTSSDGRRTAIDEGVGWIARTQNESGRFMYRYDAATDAVMPGYVWIRHAGTMMALAQVVAAELDTTGAASSSFSRALDAAIEKLATATVDGEVRSGLREGGYVSTGGTALLLLAVTESGIRDPDLVEQLGRHLVASVAPGPENTSVILEQASPELEFVPGSVSRFTTGEAAFALARLERLQPGRGWGDAVPAILDYLALHKADAEGFVPDMPDHWAAYAMGEMTRWSESSWSDVVGARSGDFDDVHVAWANKQMGLNSIMVRYESQRTNRGFDRWLRGRTSLGSAIGTHGEALGGWWDVAEADDRFAGVRAGLRDRLACNAGVVTSRQIDATEALSYVSPDDVRGSWLWFDITQVDDQQHAVSALVAAERILDAGGELPRRDTLPHSWWMLVLAVVAVVNPARLSRSAFRLGPSSLAVGIVLLVFDRAILRALDVSVPTALVAAGVVAIVGSLLGLIPRLVAPSSVLAFWRPEVIVLVVAAGGRPWALTFGLLLAYGLSLTTRASHRKSAANTTIWLDVMWVLVAVAAGIALIVDGVYAV
jgi:hypothetical protein